MIWICVLFFVLFAFSAFALPPQHFILDFLRSEVRDKVLCVDMSLTVDNEDGLRDMLRDGAVLQLTIDVEMARHRSWWTNSTVVELSYESVIRHDPLTRDFLVSMDGALVRDRNLTRLLHATWRKLSLPVVSLDTFAPDDTGSEYILSVNIRLRHSEVPPWLEKSLIFWSADVVPEEKRSLPFHASDL